MSLHTRSIVSKIGTEHLHANVSPHAGREHLDPIDDRLRENIAPTGHLQHAAHLVIHQIPFGAGLSGPEEDVFGKRCLQLLAQLIECLELIDVVGLSQLHVDGRDAKRLGLRTVLGVGDQAGLHSGFGHFLQRIPGVSFNTPVEQFPIDFLDLLMPQFHPLVFNGVQKLTGEGLMRRCRTIQ